MPSTALRRIQLSDIEATPWKNGGGVTREIATGLSPGTGQGWGWRFSIADVEQDGPFSIFSGVDRAIAVIEGSGMDLVHSNGSVTALEPLQVVKISGEESLFGRLRSGPVRDLNIMTQRDRFEATMEIWRGPRAVVSQINGHACLLIHNLAGSCTVRLAGGQVDDLTPGETLIQEGRGSFDAALADDSRAAAIWIKPK